jgi:hypothetical protein
MLATGVGGIEGAFTKVSSIDANEKPAQGTLSSCKILLTKKSSSSN